MCNVSENTRILEVNGQAVVSRVGTLCISFQVNTWLNIVVRPWGSGLILIDGLVAFVFLSKKTFLKLNSCLLLG